MSALIDPRFWLALIIWTAAVGYFADHRATKIERKAAENRELKISNEAKAAKIAADKETMAREQKMAEDFDKRIALNHKEQSDEKAAADRLIADLRARNKRLSIPVVNPVCGAGADAYPGAAPGTGGEGRAELTPGAAEFLVRLVERGDAGIRKHATVVDLYNKLRQECMKR